MPPSVSAPFKGVVLRYRFHARTLAELEAARAPLRAAHLALAQEALAAKTLLIGGACALPSLALRVVSGACVPSMPTADERMESLLVFASVADARAFAERDPYTTGGIVDSMTVRPWTVVVADVEQLR